MRKTPSIRPARLLGLLVCLLALGMTAAPSFANVFAAHLSAAGSEWNFGTQGNLTITYRLNQPATAVTIEVYRAADPGTVIKTIAGTTTWGLNTVVWDGTKDGGGLAPKSGAYKFRVKAEDSVGASTWTNITPLEGGSEIGSAQYYAPQGLAINRDQASPFFGQIYVSSANATLSVNPGASAAAEGLFLLNSDMTFRGGSAATAAAAANANLIFNVASNNSPFKLNINHDNWNEVLMCDFSDTYENVWVFNADGTAVKRLMNKDTTGPAAPAGSYNHGNQFEAALRGTGAARQLFGLDEDLDAGVVHSVAGPDFLRWDVGAVQEDYTGPAVELLNGGYVIPPPQTGTGTSTSFYTGRGLYIGEQSGDAYICNRRQNYTNNIGFSRFDLDADGNVAGTVWTLRNNQIIEGILAVNPDFPACWTMSTAIAVDETRGRGVTLRDGLATVASGCSVAVPGARAVVFDTDNGAVLAAFQISDLNTVQDAEFDAAGNLYTGCQSDELVRMWSPPDGPNSFTTTYYGNVATSNLKVTVEQAGAQADPTGTSPINFTATFSAPVTGFDSADVIVGGTGEPTGATVTGGPSVYNIAVTGMSGNGTVTASIAPDAAVDGSGNPNQPSTSVDNTVLYQAPETVGKAKTRTDGTLVWLADVVVTKIIGNDFFVQDKDRAAGVRVVVSGGTPSVAVNTLVSLTGTVGTAGAERILNVALADITAGAAFTAVPLQTRSSDAGGDKVASGVGLPDDGLLATVAGKVTETDFYSYVYLDDGSVVANDSTTPVKGIKIDLTTSTIGIVPLPDQYAKVTGVVRALQAGDKVIPVIQPRDDADIAVE